MTHTRDCVPHVLLAVMAFSQAQALLLLTSLLSPYQILLPARTGVARTGRRATTSALAATSAPAPRVITATTASTVREAVPRPAWHGNCSQGHWAGMGTWLQRGCVSHRHRWLACAGRPGGNTFLQGCLTVLDPPEGCPGQRKFQPQTGALQLRLPIPHRWAPCAWRLPLPAVPERRQLPGD